MKRVVVLAAVMSAVGGIAVIGIGPVAATPRQAIATSRIAAVDRSHGTSRIGDFAITGAANALSTDGDIGASGGLVTLDTGQASLTTRLDSTPSSSVLAQPVRPGSFFETLASLLPSGTPLPTSVPDAESAYPGKGRGSLELVKPTKVGPLRVGGGSATTRATKTSVSGHITGESSELAPLFTSGAARSSISASAAESAAKLLEQSHTSDSDVEVAKVLTLNNIDASASLSVQGTKYVEHASVTVGSASVAGQPVSIGSDGITALGHGLLPGSTTKALTKTLNSTLKTAGVTVKAIDATTHHGGRSSYANTGGIQVTVKTPTLPAGIAGNVVTVTFGSIVLTEQDAAGLPTGPPPPQPTKPPASHHRHHHQRTRGSGTTTSPGGTPAVHLPSGGSPPPAIASPPAATTELVLAGHAISHQELLAGFAGWQFLSLMTPTLYAIASSRRRRPTTRRLAR